jgi:CoA:oxalate CoA-transferase
MATIAQQPADAERERQMTDATTQSGPSAPLEGIRVLDFTMVMAGPFCTRILADLGAEVIKVEPASGDQIRGRPPVRDGRSTYFGQMNVGKQSIVLDLKHPEAIALARRLAAKSDIVVENFRPGVMQRLGLGYDTLSADNPRLIYCAISGFGQTGPSAGKPAYAPIIHAASGYDMANLHYQDDMDRPARTGIFMADVLGATYGFAGIQTALYMRERTGLGQYVDVALMDSMLSLLVFEGQEAQFPTKRRRPLYHPLRTADGYIIVAPVSEKIFGKMCDALGHPEWRADLRFSQINEREQHWDALMGLIEEWTQQRSSMDAEAHLTAAGVPSSRYLTSAEALQDPQLAHRGSLAEVADASGTFLVPNQPFQISNADIRARGTVPELGGDAEDVLRDILGSTPDEIRALRASGAIG